MDDLDYISKKNPATNSTVGNRIGHMRPEHPMLQVRFDYESYFATDGEIQHFFKNIGGRNDWTDLGPDSWIGAK